MNKKIISLLVASGLLATQAIALPVNITRQDPTVGEGFGALVNGVGIGFEDNETEPGTVQGQNWDMEAFVVDGTKLYIVGGYNMLAGESASGGSVVAGKLVPGDLFIKVDTGSTGNPGFAPTASTPGTVNNAVYGYTHVVDLTNPVGATGAFGIARTVNAASLFDTVIYDSFGANPWRYNSGQTGSVNTGILYTQNATATQLSNIGLSGLLGYGSNNTHNILEVDLSFLGNVANGTNVYFSYTMECGNDSLKGRYSGGFDQVPDGASSAILIGLGLAGLAIFSMKRRNS